MRALLEKFRRNFDPPRTLSFTRIGTYFVLLTLGVGVAAINTGNNLLFLLLGMMLAVIVASGLLSEAVLRNLRGRRSLPNRAFAGRRALGALEIGNPNLWPSLSVELREAELERRVGPRHAAPLQRPGTAWWKFWAADASTDVTETAAGAYYLRVDSGASEEAEVAYRFPTRGVYELRALRLTTRFPFSLFEKSRTVSRPATFVVYPEPRPAPEWNAELRGGLGEVESGERGRGDEYYGLREYRPGEDRRLIHWKRSAARGEIVVREHEQKSNRAVRLHLRNAVPGELTPARGRAFEEALSRMTGLVQTFARRGWSVGLRTLDCDVPASESTDLEAIFRELARVQVHEQTPGAATEPGDSSRTADVLVAFEPPKSSRKWDAVLPIGSTSEEIG